MQILVNFKYFYIITITYSKLWQDRESKDKNVRDGCCP